MKLFTVKVSTQNLQLLSKLPAWIDRTLFSEVTKQSRRLTDFVRNVYLSGPMGSTKLGVRSGELRKGTRPLTTKKQASSITGGMVIGENTPKYTTAWVGPRGQERIITPVRGQALAIPLTAALTSKGLLKAQYAKVGSLRDVPGLFRIGDTLFKRSGKELVPLFVLKRQVTQRTRVWPEYIAALQGPFIVNEIRTAVQEEIDRRTSGAN